MTNYIFRNFSPPFYVILDMSTLW